ncbi:MAG: hypothetical protein KJ626_00600 [Verrucomicrobia bacterium]|nr:hypothetical protein [Verrucomicrobiota bacterium]
MDLGIFRRSKRVLAAWLVLPVLVIVVLHFSVKFYCWSAGRELRNRSQVVQVLPKVKRSLELARETISAYRLDPESRAEPSEELRLQLNEAAAASGFTVNTLSIEEADKSVSIGERALLVTVKGEGNQAALTTFLGRLEQSHSLLELQNAKFRIMKLIADPVFYGEMKFYFYDLGI